MSDVLLMAITLQHNDGRRSGVAVSVAGHSDKQNQQFQGKVTWNNASSIRVYLFFKQIAFMGSIHHSAFMLSDTDAEARVCDCIVLTARAKTHNMAVGKGCRQS